MPYPLYILFLSAPHMIHDLPSNVETNAVEKTADFQEEFTQAPVIKNTDHFKDTFQFLPHADKWIYMYPSRGK